MSTGERGAAAAIRGFLLVIVVTAVTGWLVVRIADREGSAGPSRSTAGDSGPASPVGEGDATAAPTEPAQRVLAQEDFDSGGDPFTAHTLGQAQILVTAGHGDQGGHGRRLVVPRQNQDDAAWLNLQLDVPQTILTASGWFKIRRGGCDPRAVYSRGNIPFFRFFDAAGDRMVSLFRINGECGETGQVYLQHSGGYYQSPAAITFGKWHRISLTAAPAPRGRTALAVVIDGRQVYGTSLARFPARRIASVGVGNDVPGQKGAFVVDDLEVSTPVAR